MVSNVTAALSGAPFAPSVWEVANAIYGRRLPEDPAPDLALPPGWGILHRNNDDNPPGQALLQISTRDSFFNLRAIGYVANIRRAKETRFTSTPFQMSVICQLTSRTSPLFFLGSLSFTRVISGHFKVPPARPGGFFEDVGSHLRFFFVFCPPDARLRIVISDSRSEIVLRA